MDPRASVTKPRRRVRVALVLLVGLGVVSWAVSILAIQRAMLFPRFAVAPLRDPAAGVPGLERLEISSSDGPVEAFFLPAEGASAERPAPLVVFAHGNAELIDYWPSEMARYRRMGVHVLLPEYRGYGRSAGSPSEAAITEDLIAFHDLAVRRPDVDRTRIVYHGRSLGGGAVAALARSRPPAAMILQSTFTSVADVARRWLVPRFLILDPFDTLEVVRTLDVPMLLVHGRRDSLIPVSHAERLRDAARDARLVLYDADHNDCPPDWNALFDEIRTFLGSAGIL